MVCHSTKKSHKRKCSLHNSRAHILNTKMRSCAICRHSSYQALPFNIWVAHAYSLRAYIKPLSINLLTALKFLNCARAYSFGYINWYWYRLGAHFKYVRQSLWCKYRHFRYYIAHIQTFLQCMYNLTHIPQYQRQCLFFDRPCARQHMLLHSYLQLLLLSFAIRSFVNCNKNQFERLLH